MYDCSMTRTVKREFINPKNRNKIEMLGAAPVYTSIYTFKTSKALRKITFFKKIDMTCKMIINNVSKR